MIIHLRKARFLTLVVVLFSIFALSSGESFTSQDEGSEKELIPPMAVELQKKGYIVSDDHCFVFLPPEGFYPLSKDETEATIQKGRESEGFVSDDGAQAGAAPSSWIIFRPSGSNSSLATVAVTSARSPVFFIPKSVDEFVHAYTPSTGDFVYFSMENTVVNNKAAFVIDREYDSQGKRMRQVVAFIFDYTIRPGGFLAMFSSLSVNFDEHVESFAKSLAAFTVLPPKITGDIKEKLYSRDIAPEKEEDWKPAWQSIEVIGGLVFVAMFVIWYLVKRLSDSSDLPDRSDSTDVSDKSDSSD